MKLAYCGCTIGTDPELFLRHNGQIIGSEKVLPKDGIGPQPPPGCAQIYDVVRDGIQVELHPTHTSCRANVGNAIRGALTNLKNHIDTQGMKGVEISFESVVRISPEEMASLSPESRILGCQPSLNWYDPNLRVDVPEDYPIRSAGGHLHLGLEYDTMIFAKERQIIDYEHPKVVAFRKEADKKGSYSAAYYRFMETPPMKTLPARDHRVRLVPLLEILLGNTCVMIDRDPLAAERRKVYGRAGEYRLPAHGLEYRVLSNFWLQSYQLFSLVAGICKMATTVLNTGLMARDGKPDDEGGTYVDLESALLGMVDMEKIRRAIDTNDLQLAKENWKIVRQFIGDVFTAPNATPPGGNVIYSSEIYPLMDHSLDKFQAFLDRIEETGDFKCWFWQDPLQHWLGMPEGHGCGWENWLLHRLPGMLAVEEEFIHPALSGVGEWTPIGSEVVAEGVYTPEPPPPPVKIATANKYKFW